MDLHFKTKDHPEANGRQPQFGESAWSPYFPLENGDVLHLHMGEQGRDAMFGMMIAECKDSGEGEPKITIFPTFVAGFDSRQSIRNAVPQTFGEAVACWGPQVVCCEPHEWDNRATEENAVWLLCRLHVRKLLSQMKKWKRAESKQYMLMETIGDGPKINNCDSWLCPYKNFASFLHDTLDGMDDPKTIATIRFTFMEMDDVEFEEYCVEKGIEWKE